MTGAPLLLYVPGLLPKPEAERHKAALHRCLLAGLRRTDRAVAENIECTPGSFDIVAWTYDFYGEHRDMTLDAAAIDAVIGQQRPDARDIEEASSWSRRTAAWLFSIADLLPFLIPHVANERMEVHLRDLRRYLRDRNGIAEHVRQMLKLPLRAAAEGERPVLLLAHSMGSVIAFDTLWELTHRDRDARKVDLLVTMGSPLGQRFLQRRLLGAGRVGAERYPHNIRRWINLAAVGDLTAIDPTLADDFAEMTRRGFVDSIEDFELQNYFRLQGELNVHAEYGYLVNDVTARVVAEWWRSRDSALQ